MECPAIDIDFMNSFCYFLVIIDVYELINK